MNPENHIIICYLQFILILSHVFLTRYSFPSGFLTGTVVLLYLLLPASFLHLINENINYLSKVYLGLQNNATKNRDNLLAAANVQVM